jgi:SNF2 family DNA or RNA helicase
MIPTKEASHMPVAALSRAAPGTSLGTLTYPYAPAVTEVVRRVPGREFNKAYKLWLFPLTPSNVLLLRDGLKEIGWDMTIPRDLATELNRAYARQQKAMKVRAAGDSDIEFDFVTEPYAHQRAGLAFLKHLDGGALLWEMGLGKTKTAIDFAEMLAGKDTSPTPWQPDQRSPAFRVLVICPNTVKRNWRTEVGKHAGHDDVVIPTGTIPQRVRQLGSARYTIVNAEALSHKPMADGLIKAGPWDLVVVDESTRFKTPEAARTKALMKIPTRRRVILTGTPITGNPTDAYIQFEWVSPGTFGKSFWAFKERYVEKDWFGNVVGIKPGMADELRARIDATSYRILKADVLDLPEKVYSDRVVEMKGEQRRAYDQMRDELRIQLADEEITANNILTVLLRLTQVTAGMVGERGRYQWLDDNAKVDELDHLLREDLANEQVVIFGLYQFELEQLAKRYDDGSFGVGPYALPIIYGPTPERVRHELIEQFQEGQRRLLFCQVRTGGIGINLTAAQTAIYTTRSWSLEEYLQSQDRLHRIGQTGTVSIIHLLAEASIDEDISKALAEKKNTADHLTGDAARALAARLLGR